MHSATWFVGAVVDGFNKGDERGGDINADADVDVLDDGARLGVTAEGWEVAAEAMVAISSSFFVAGFCSGMWGCLVCLLVLHHA